MGHSFGGSGGSVHVMDVGLDEVIEKMEGMTIINGQLIDQVTFTMKNTPRNRDALLGRMERCLCS